MSKRVSRRKFLTTAAAGVTLLPAAAARTYAANEAMARQAEKMGQRSAAATFYSRIVSDYPGSSAAARAKEGLASLRR